jgi:hypothetical protein
VADFRERPLDAGPYTFVAADALTVKVRAGGPVAKNAVIVATGVNNDGHAEIVGAAISTGERLNREIRRRTDVLGSSPTAARSFGSSARSWPSSTTSGPTAAAPSASNPGPQPPRPDPQHPATRRTARRDQRLTNNDESPSYTTHRELSLLLRRPGAGRASVPQSQPGGGAGGAWLQLTRRIAIFRPRRPSPQQGPADPTAACRHGVGPTRRRDRITRPEWQAAVRPSACR